MCIFFIVVVFVAYCWRYILTKVVGEKLSKIINAVVSSGLSNKCERPNKKHWVYLVGDYK